MLHVQNVHAQTNFHMGFYTQRHLLLQIWASLDIVCETVLAE